MSPSRAAEGMPVIRRTGFMRPTTLRLPAASERFAFAKTQTPGRRDAYRDRRASSLPCTTDGFSFLPHNKHLEVICCDRLVIYNHDCRARLYNIRTRNHLCQAPGNTSEAMRPAVPADSTARLGGSLAEFFGRHAGRGPGRFYHRTRPQLGRILRKACGPLSRPSLPQG